MSWLIVYGLLSTIAHSGVVNPYMILGTPVSGATTSAPLFADSNGLLSSGEPATTWIGLNGAITTTSTVDVLMTGLTITVPVAGTWQVIANSTMSGNTSGAIIYMSIWAGGAQVVGSEQRSIPFFASGAGLGAGTSNIAMTGSTFAEATLTAGQTIEIRWRATSGTGTSTNRAMMIRRVR